VNTMLDVGRARLPPQVDEVVIDIGRPLQRGPVLPSSHVRHRSALPARSRNQPGTAANVGSLD
jgi:hypothetical protein